MRGNLFFAVGFLLASSFVLLIVTLPVHAQPALRVAGASSPLSAPSSVSAMRALRKRPRQALGTGAKRHPNATMITNCAGLQSMSLSGNYKLVNDITDCRTNFTPIGSSGAPFTGTFDGNGFAINPLTINSNAAAVGLFGYVAGGGGILNVRLLNASITGADQNCAGGVAFVGGIAGYSTTDIGGSFIQGEVSVVSDESPNCGGIVIGGVVGYNGQEVLNSSANATVSVSTESLGVVAGGLIGSQSLLVQNSWATGNVVVVAPSAQVGGLLGATSATCTQTYVESSFATGSVYLTGSGDAGGLIGEIGDPCYAPNVGQAFATGSVSGSDFVGGLVGFADGGNYNDLFATGNVQSATGGAAGGLIGGTGAYCCTTELSSAYSSGKVSEVDPGNRTRGLVGETAVPLLNGADDDEEKQTED